MSLTSQLFLLFYAVLFGAIFTVTDRWRPFAVPHRSGPNLRRLALSTVFFGILPIAYFLIVLPFFLGISCTSRICLAVAIYAVAPLVGFHFCWGWIVVSYVDAYYDREQQHLEPIRTSLMSLGGEPGSRRHVTLALAMAVFILGPIASVLVLWWLD